jgi:hypothetical protein
MNILNYLNSFNVFLLWLSFTSLGLFTYTAYKLNKTNKKLNSLSEEQSKKWVDIELKAQNDYQKIIDEANRKALEISRKATEVNNDSSAKLQQAVDEMVKNQKDALTSASSSILTTHKNEVTELNKHILEVAGKVYKDIEVNSRTDMQAFLEVIKKQTFEAENYAQQRIKEEYEKLEKDVALKREQKIKKLDENIYKILTNISKDIIGKALDLSSQEELIIKSLNQAKKEGGL